MPTGNELYGTLLIFGYFPRICLGSRLGFAQQLEKIPSTKAEYGFLRWNTTVYLLVATALARKSKRAVSLLARLFTVLALKTTSSAVNGAPSDHTTPLRKW